MSPINSHKITPKILSISLFLLVASVGFALSVLALLSVKLGVVPWGPSWSSAGTLSTDVKQAVTSSAYEIVAAALVAMNFLAFYLYRYLITRGQRDSESSGSYISGVDLDLGHDNELLINFDSVQFSDTEDRYEAMADFELPIVRADELVIDVDIDMQEVPADNGAIVNLEPVNTIIELRPVKPDLEEAPRKAA